MIVHMNDLERFRRLFPSKFPFDQLCEIHRRVPEALHSEDSCEVYRIALFGRIDREFFLPTILEDRNKERYSAIRTESIGLDEWSVSCYTEKKDVDKTLKMLKKYYPPSRLATGNICEGTGLWALSKDWNKKKNSHVDWWIFKDECPIHCFRVLS